MSDDFLPVPAVIERIDRTVEDNFLFDFCLAEGLDPEPGQFLELSIPGVGAFPVSTAAFGMKGLFQGCIRRVGRATSALFSLREGDRVAFRGPFGKGFPLETFFGKDVLLVAGGLGVVPLRGLLQALLAHRERYGEIIFLYGSREPETILFKDELASMARAGQIRLRFSVDFTTELPWAADSFICKVGLVTELLENLQFLPERTVAAVCGPPSLYSCVPEELASLGVPAERIFLSLERHMKCGIGQCCHCVTAGVFVCREGPVFPLSQLRGMPGAI